MKTPLQPLVCGLLASLATLDSQLSTAFAQGTSFTYQGSLNENGAPANSIYDLTFTLYTAVSGGGTVGTSNVVNDLAVSNGLFTVTLDFGPSAFIGAERWLEIAVRPGASTGAYTNLIPRQPITSVPYAIFASSVNASTLIGQVTDANLSTTLSFARTFSSPGNQYFGNGANLTALNASQLTTGTVPAAALGNAWKIGGNAGTTPGTHFLGTTDNQALEFKVNNQRGLRLEYANNGFNFGVNVIGGYSGNFVSSSAVGATIAGGGHLLFGETNKVLADFGTVGGGNQNTTESFYATVGGGLNNTAGGTGSTIGGGLNNTTIGLHGAIPGGANNTAAKYAFAAGQQAKAINQGAFVWADASGADFASTAENQFLIRAAGGVAIGTNNPAGASLRVVGTIKADAFEGMGTTLMLGTTDNQPLEFKVNGQRALRLEPSSGFPNIIGGYSSNTIDPGILTAIIAGGGGIQQPNAITNAANYAVIGGGKGNVIGGAGSGGSASVIGGGDRNTVSGQIAVVGGGQFNSAGANYSVIPGGANNTVAAGAIYAFAAGQRAKANHAGTFVWSDSQAADFASSSSNQFLIRASGGVGIGTTAPVKSLDVLDAGGPGGNIHVGDTSTGVANRMIHFGDIHPSGRGYAAVGEGDVDDRLLLIGGTVVITNQSGSSRVGIDRVATANALEVNGDASKTTAGGWLANSDARIKKDIQPVTGALDKLDQVRLVSFRYTDDYRQAHASVEDRPYLNVVAQEFREVFPEHVKSSGEKLPDGSEILQVDTYPLTIYSAAAVQELNGQMKQLKNAMKRRDAENADLKQRLEKLEGLLTQQNGGAR